MPLTFLLRSLCQIVQQRAQNKLNRIKIGNTEDVERRTCISSEQILPFLTADVQNCSVELTSELVHWGDEVCIFDVLW